ncbi:MAG: molecular chaperone DnaJ [Alkalinema sp. RU_4_3]|nr:molecular chaperone DnaJ [Alkalinema sp. RU_4_3]
MNSPHEILGIPIDASPAQAKAAYHAKLRAFPAHTHPTEFKAIRSAYEALSKGGQADREDFFKVRPIEDRIEPAVIESLKEDLIAHFSVSLEDMLRNTF